MNKIFQIYKLTIFQGIKGLINANHPIPAATLTVFRRE